MLTARCGGWRALPCRTGLRGLPGAWPTPDVCHCGLVDGRRLRALRRARGLSQERLAWAAGVDLHTVARLERHPRPQCRGLTLTLLAEALGEHPHALVSAGPADQG